MIFWLSFFSCSFLNAAQVAARKHDSATAVTLASKDPAFHVSRVAPATPFWRTHALRCPLFRSSCNILVVNVQKELKEREQPVRKDDGRPHIDPREARANEVARGMTGILSSAAPIAKFLTRIAS